MINSFLAVLTGLCVHGPRMAEGFQGLVSERRPNGSRICFRGASGRRRMALEIPRNADSMAMRGTARRERLAPATVASRIAACRPE